MQNPVKKMLGGHWKLGKNAHLNRKKKTIKEGLSSRLHAGIAPCEGHLVGVKLAILLAFSGFSFLCPLQNVFANDGPFEYIFISWKGDQIIAIDGNSKDTLRESSLPREIIEWALTQADAAILQEGRYEIRNTLEIPRSNVSLIIGEDATLAAQYDAHLTIMSEGHGNYISLIRNKNRDNVKIINLGTLDGGRIMDGSTNSRTGLSAVNFDGRNGGTTGINGGLIFSTGEVVNTWDSFFMVDSKNVKVPLLWIESQSNCPLVMEGNEDCRLGIIVGLMGEESYENETVDLNSFNERLQFDTIIGWTEGGETRDEILDINNSPDCTMERVIGFGPGEKLNLVSRNKYGPGGRRLTQKPYIDNNSMGTVVKETEIREKKVKSWEKTFETPGFPASLPVMKINASLTAVFEDGSREEIFERNYEFNLAGSKD